ncbi:hypothetical protein CCP2SC5_430023 [Azospirillaceae bacterium]
MMLEAIASLSDHSDALPAFVVRVITQIIIRVIHPAGFRISRYNEG